MWVWSEGEDKVSFGGFDRSSGTDSEFALFKDAGLGYHSEEIFEGIICYLVD